MELLGSHAASIQSVLDFTSQQHRVIQQNLANLNTPGYKAKTLNFDEELGRAVIEDRKGVQPAQNGNTVVMEIENADLRKNQLVYRLFLQAMAHQVRMTRSAVAGRGQ